MNWKWNFIEENWFLIFNVSATSYHMRFFLIRSHVYQYLRAFDAENIETMALATKCALAYSFNSSFRCNNILICKNGVWFACAFIRARIWMRFISVWKSVNIWTHYIYYGRFLWKMHGIVSLFRTDIDNDIMCKMQRATSIA